MISFRKPEDDKRKSARAIKEQIKSGKACIICGDPISLMEGPGSDSLCRKHQLEQREYRGLGRLDRPHTFHRKWECEECGVNVLEDPRLNKVLDEVKRHRIARSMMHADHHYVRKADGGSDGAENIKSLCYVCHLIKTELSGDNRKN